MLHDFGLYKRPLLTVLAVLLTTAFTTASAAMIDLSQLTPNTTQPVALSTIQSNTSNEASTLTPKTNMEPVIKVAATPTTTPISGASEKATINATSTSRHGGHYGNPSKRAKVTIVVPATWRNGDTGSIWSLHDRSLVKCCLLKYPYYDTTIVSTNTPTAEIKAADLAQIAEAQNSEIVIMPVPLQDVYVQVNTINSPDPYNKDNHEIYIAAKVNALLYYYDVNDKVIHTVRTGFNQTDDSLTMPTHKSVWNKVMTILLDKLPYKRIPTDRDRYQAPGINSEAPVVLDFQVEQPKNTAYSLKGVSVL
ncbi:MAG: hypothetical protein ACLRU1_05925 [Veillonella parvula]